MTTFTPTIDSKLKYDQATGNKKLSVFSEKALGTWGEMLICVHCEDNWNEHNSLGTNL